MIVVNSIRISEAIRHQTDRVDEALQSGSEGPGQEALLLPLDEGPGCLRENFLLGVTSEN